MDALLHEIIARKEQKGWASLDDFVLGPGQGVSAPEVVSQPGWSLFGLDKGRGIALFVEIDPSFDLAKSPFVFADQHRLARRMLTVPLQALPELANRFPEPKSVIFIFSIGRCGSTLIADALNAAPQVWSLSEPDAFSTLIMQQYYSGERLDFPPEQVVELIRACSRLLFRPPEGAGRSILSVKLKSQSLFQADLFHRAMPAAKFVFLYRDGVSWCHSVYQMMRKYGTPALLTGDDRTLTWTCFTAASDQAFLRQHVDIDAPEVPAELALAPAWVANMTEYNRHLQGGVPFLALRYNEINTARAPSLHRLFAHCGLPEGFVAQALNAFDHDSQAGTKIARDVTSDRLDAAQLLRLAQIIESHGTLGDAGLRLADIYS